MFPEAASFFILILLYVENAVSVAEKYAENIISITIAIIKAILFHQISFHKINGGDRGTVLKERGCKASELAKIMDVYPQVLVNAQIKNENKNRYMENPEVRKAVEELEKKFEGEGRVLIRPSGTEPLVRVMIEGKDIEQMRADAEKLAQIIERNLM